MILRKTTGLGDDSNMLGPGDAEVLRQARDGALQGAAQVQGAFRSMPVGLVPAGILTYGLIKRSRTAMIVGGVWAGLNVLSWLNQITP